MLGYTGSFCVEPFFCIYQKETQCKQAQCTPGDMALQLQQVVTLLPSVLQGKRHRHANDKQEGGEYHIYKAHGICGGGHVFHPLRNIPHAGQLIYKYHGKNGNAPECVYGKYALVVLQKTVIDADEWVLIRI